MESSSVRILLLLLLLSVALSSCTPAGNSQAATPDFLTVGSSYKLGLSFVVMKFKVLELQDAGWIKVQAEEDSRGIGIRKDEQYWLNIAQISLVQAVQ